MAKQVAKKSNSTASVVLTIEDIKRISKVLGIPSSAFLSLIFDNDSNAFDARADKFHPKLLSVIPSNLEKVLNQPKKK